MSNVVLSKYPSGYTQQGGPASAAIVGQTGNMLQMQLEQMNSNINATKEGAEQPFFLANGLVFLPAVGGSVFNYGMPNITHYGYLRETVISGSRSGSNSNGFQVKSVSHTHYQLDFGGQSGGGWDVNSSSFKFVNTSTGILNSQSQIAEAASTMAKNDVARGLKAPYSSMKSQINTLNKIGNVAKYGGAATSLISVGLSYLKYQSTGKITASDGIGLLSASVAVTEVFLGGPVIVGSGLILGAIQLVGGEYTDTITIYNRGNTIPLNRN